MITTYYHSFGVTKQTSKDRNNVHIEQNGINGAIGAYRYGTCTNMIMFVKRGNMWAAPGLLSLFTVIAEMSVVLMTLFWSSK